MGGGGGLLDDVVEIINPITNLVFGSPEDTAKTAALDAASAQREALADQRRTRAEEKAALEAERNKELAEGNRDSARSKQRAASKRASGRSGTILTTGTEEAGPTAKKTLLGQ